MHLGSNNEQLDLFPTKNSLNSYIQLQRVKSHSQFTRSNLKDLSHTFLGHEWMAISLIAYDSLFTNWHKSYMCPVPLDSSMTQIPRYLTWETLDTTSGRNHKCSASLSNQIFATCSKCCTTTSTPKSFPIVHFPVGVILFSKPLYAFQTRASAWSTKDQIWAWGFSQCYICWSKAFSCKGEEQGTQEYNHFCS